MGDGLLDEFARQNREFDRVLALVQPEDWEKLCYHRLRPETVRSKVDIRVAELAMHEWDMRWALDPEATLAEDSLPGLVNASGRAVRRAFRPDSSRTRLGPICALPVYPQWFILSGQTANSVDVVLAPEGASFEIGASTADADVTFRCSSATYAMLIFGRYKLGPVIEQGLVEADGDERLVSHFITSFVGG